MHSFASMALRVYKRILKLIKEFLVGWSGVGQATINTDSSKDSAKESRRAQVNKEVKKVYLDKLYFIVNIYIYILRKMFPQVDAVASKVI